MKHVFKLCLYIAALLGAGIITFLIINHDSMPPEGLFRWISDVSTVVSAIMIGLGIYQYRRLNIVRKDYKKYMDEDAYDKYRYNKFNEIKLFGVLSLILSMVGLILPIAAELNTGLFPVSGIIFVASLFLITKGSGLVKKLYPERQLPESYEKGYAEKLLSASDEGERHIMLNALYKTFGLTQSALIFGLVAMFLYSVITGDSQAFGIIVTAILMIIIQLKYAFEIMER